ncbi:hypothetical protein ACRRVB_02655 [Candidatus Cardinium hertigii]|uniref:CIS tube protein n=1 Tax=Candidatus Cardinium hertigii TaxID=247481 RepID=UPI003D7E08A9
MSNVSKLVIKACNDNKFSSFTGEFITSINPENLTIKSAVSYHVPEGMPGANLLKYCGSPPKLLSFSLLFDNTGIIPGSNRIAVMEQVKQLQNITYNPHKKHNAPNYIRIIWGHIDFKGRLVDLDIVYSMFQVDGTLVRAEARIAVLEELVPVGKGKSAPGIDTNYTKPSTNRATVHPTKAGQSLSSDTAFGPTPNGMDGAYSGAPDGAYSGAPDDIYHGAGSSHQMDGSSMRHAGKPTASMEKDSAGNYGARGDIDRSTGSTHAASYSTGSNVDDTGNGFQGGVAGNGPGGSGGGIGGGGHRLAIDSGASGGDTVSTGIGGSSNRSATNSKSYLLGGSMARSSKHNAASGSSSHTAKGKGKRRFPKTGKTLAGHAAAAGGAAAAVAANAPDSLRKLSGLKANVNVMRNKISFLRRLKNFAKKVAPRAYDAGKKIVKSSGF